MTDFHSHLLPGADHGCTSVGESERQLRLLWEAGVTGCVVTPHFDPKYMTTADFLSRRDRSADLFRDAARPEGMEVFLGAEVRLCHHLNSMPGLPSLAVRGTDVILIEMPPCEWDDALTDTLLRISDAGLRPVLAHPDRYPAEDVEALFRLGLRGQLNADAFRRAGLRRRQRLLGWIDRGWILAFGSDLHGSSPEYAKSLRILSERVGAERLARVEETTQRLLADAVPIEKCLPAPIPR